MPMNPPAGPRYDLDRILKQLDAFAGAAISNEMDIAQFRRVISSFIPEEMLATTIEERMDRYLRGFAARRGGVKNINDLQELMFTMWAEGFVVGSALSERRHTGRSPLD